MQHNDHVFINCPFDENYKSLFDAIVFAVQDCGFVARCAMEIEDSSQVRIEKILQLIEECRLGIHDISRTELDRSSRLPRFNMPLELGMFLGAKRFGAKEQRKKQCLILDRDRYRYQKFCSDIAGSDIRAHEGEPLIAIKIVRDWLRNVTRGSASLIPGAPEIARRYEIFCSELPGMCSEMKLAESDLIFNDYIMIIAAWLEKDNSTSPEDGAA